MKTAKKLHYYIFYSNVHTFKLKLYNDVYFNICLDSYTIAHIIAVCIVVCWTPFAPYYQLTKLSLLRILKGQSRQIRQKIIEKKHKVTSYRAKLRWKNWLSNALIYLREFELIKVSVYRLIMICIRVAKRFTVQ
jgi:hypothetical protein